MKKLSYIERVIKNELEPHILRNKERGHRRHLNNTLFDYKERDRNRYRMSGSRSLIVLIKAGIPYQRACEILGKPY